VTHAHTIPRQWDGVHLQTIDHLTAGLEGQIVHHCGDGPCTADNTGSP
jgi:hypothetical protein